jgi:gliding motility-associated-like protein
LDKNPELCIASFRTLDPGAYKTYLWQDGSTQRSFEVHEPGRYFVTVSDEHHCRASDTVSITTLLPLPSNFLPNDTLTCSYGTLTLKPLQSYNSYQWSTGSLSSSISIDKPGVYWLQVQDNKSCIGRDSILVNPKDCLKGAYIPSAFTPNYDGHNDVFKAKVFGPLKQFELMVYNRWGTVVFHTKDPEKGWDGFVKGQRSDSGIFIWQCRYQLENEPEKIEKGTVTLLR